MKRLFDGGCLLTYNLHFLIILDISFYQYLNTSVRDTASKYCVVAYINNTIVLYLNCVMV